jgi:hypothetical protein
LFSRSRDQLTDTKNILMVRAQIKWYFDMDFHEHPFLVNAFLM